MRLPDDSHRATIYGKTGSGKTIAALWQLSHRSYDTKPWIVLDFKGDINISQIPYTKEFAIGDTPQEPGIWLAHPIPEVDDEKVEKTLWGIWRNENTGLYVDEGYMVPKKSSAYKALLTQGRSKHTPVITLTQRPVWMSRFAISEADFHQVFFLSDSDDRKVVQRFIPYDIDARLPEFHSYYYDVGTEDLLALAPVPALAEICETFEKRLGPTQKKTRRFL